MSNEKVIVTTSKLDALATSIAEKTGVSTPLTIAEMKTAIDNLSTNIEVTNIIDPTISLITGYLSSNGSMTTQQTVPKEMTTDFIDIEQYQGVDVIMINKTGNRVVPWIAICYYDSNKTKIGNRNDIISVMNSTQFVTNASGYHYNENGTVIGMSKKITLSNSAKYMKISFRTGEAGLLGVILNTDFDSLTYWAQNLNYITIINPIENNGTATE